jgi:PAS domain S-box-containing protein
MADMLRFVSNLRLVSKLAVPAAALVAAALVTLVMAEHWRASVEREVSTVINRDSARQELALSIVYDFQLGKVNSRDVRLAKTAEEVEGLAAQNEKVKARLETEIGNLSELMIGPDQKQAAADCVTAFQEQEDAIAETTAAKLESLRTGSAPPPGGKGRVALAHLEEIAAKIVVFSKDDMLLAKANAINTSRRAALVLVVGSGLAQLFALVLLVWIAVAQVARPLNRMSGAMVRLAAGDLDVPVHGGERRDEIGAFARSLRVFKENAIALRAAHLDLEHANADLEHRVEARTSELRAAKDDLQHSLEILRRKEQQLASAQKAAHVGSIERDLKSGSIDWSDECYAVFGRQRSAVPPNRGDILRLFHPEDRARYQAAMTASERGEQTLPGEFRIMRPDGAMRWIHHASVVLFDADGAPAYRIGTFRDITEERESAAAREKLVLELSAAKEKLLQQERLSILGQVAATVAHELRNPLSAIRNTNYALLQRQPAEGSVEKRGIERIQRSVARCDLIISDILEYTKVRPLTQKPLKLDLWLTAVLDELILPQGVALERRLASDGTVVALDAERFRRVVINLIDNAAQAMDAAESSIAERRITVETKAGDMAEIAVHDTGPGIPAETLAKIFEPLFTTKRQGTGLGLPTVKQIVEQHAGMIEISSVVGHGTSVRIRLPVTAAEAAAA